MAHPLLRISLDLCAPLSASERYRRLVQAVKSMVPCDACAVLRLERGMLVPVVAAGLVPDVIGKRFDPAEHPRLQRLLSATGAVRFSASDGLPDPYDGLVAGDATALSRVHACMGCPLVVEGETVGVLTVDAFDAHAFDQVEDQDMATLGALAGAAMRTAGLIEALEVAAQRQGMVARQLLRDAQRQREQAILGASPAIRRVLDDIALLGESDLTALITGETGVGKELVANAIHARSQRRDMPLVYVNCAALPESLAESELFGHVKGAFTGALEHRLGRFEVADGATLFLDEVGELSLSIQPKLLRALQSGDVQRVGADRGVRVNVRVLAATNRVLLEEVRAGRFRADLYHRLNVYPVSVPPLRDRREDIPLLAGHFLDQASRRLGLGSIRLTENARRALHQYDWPGNVRELEHVLLRASLRAARGQRHSLFQLDVEHLGTEFDRVDRAPSNDGSARSEDETVPSAPPDHMSTDSDSLVTLYSLSHLEDLSPLAEAVDAFRSRYILEAVRRSNGNWAEAARRLQLDRGNLHRLAQRLALL